MENLITSFKQIKEIIEPIPAEKFQASYYGWSPLANCHNNGPEDNGCSCVLGHIHRHFDPLNPKAIGDRNGFGARDLSEKFLGTFPGYYHCYDISDVNNWAEPVRRLYPQQDIKDRVMAFIEDGIKWEERN